MAISQRGRERENEIYSTVHVQTQHTHTHVAQSYTAFHFLRAILVASCRRHSSHTRTRFLYPRAGSGTKTLQQSSQTGNDKITRRLQRKVTE